MSWHGSFVESADELLIFFFIVHRLRLILRLHAGSEALLPERSAPGIRTVFGLLSSQRRLMDPSLATKYLPLDLRQNIRGVN